jgi:hypothetical protein
MLNRVLPTLSRVRLLAPLRLAPIVLALLACDRRLEPYVPLEAEPPRPEHPVRIPGLGNPARAERVLAQAPAPAPDAAAIRGTVRLGDGLSAPGPGVLFVVARSAAGGPPLAVVRLGSARLPQDFEIGPGDTMFPDIPFAGPLQLTARLDRDGDPMSRSGEDLVAALDAPVEPGASGVDLVLAPGP